LADFHQDHQKQNGGFPLLAYLTQQKHTLNPANVFTPIGNRLKHNAFLTAYRAK
jgi:hypothetical protein